MTAYVWSLFMPKLEKLVITKHAVKSKKSFVLLERQQ